MIADVDIEIPSCCHTGRDTPPTQRCLRRLEGGVHIVDQCQRCGGQIGGALAPDIYNGDIDALPSFDPSIKEAWDARRMEAHEKRKKQRLLRHALQGRGADWGETYMVYRQTDKWQSKRDAVLERDDYICQACRHRRATEVHHRTYDHIGSEPLFDLLAVCSPCHRKITKMDNSDRDSFFSFDPEKLNEDN